MLNLERVILNLVQNLPGRLVSASHETLKRVQGDNKTGIVTAFCAMIAGLKYLFVEDKPHPGHTINYYNPLIAI